MILSVIDCEHVKDWLLLVMLRLVNIEVSSIFDILSLIFLNIDGVIVNTCEKVIDKVLTILWGDKYCDTATVELCARIDQLSSIGWLIVTSAVFRGLRHVTMTRMVIRPRTEDWCTWLCILVDVSVRDLQEMTWESCTVQMYVSGRQSERPS